MSEGSKEQPLKENEPYLARESWGYKGVSLEFMGVQHRMPTFRAHEQEFRDQFSQSGAVLLEFAPRAEGFLTPDGSISEAIIQAQHEISGTSPDQIRRRLEELREDIDFFASLEQIAGELGKDILVMNPYSISPDEAESTDKLSKLGFAYPIVRFIGLEAVPAIQGVKTLYSAGEQAIRQKGFSRRTFFAGAAGLAGLAVAGSLALGDQQERQRLQTSASISHPNPLTVTLADMADYQNAAFSLIFTTLADAGELDPKITAVEGDGHRAPIKYYFEHQAERGLKLATVYRPMVDAAPPRVKRFHHEGGNNWVKTQDRIIKR